MSMVQNSSSPLASATPEEDLTATKATCFLKMSNAFLRLVIYTPLASEKEEALLLQKYCRDVEHISATTELH